MYILLTMDECAERSIGRLGIKRVQKKVMIIFRKS